MSPMSPDTSTSWKKRLRPELALQIDSVPSDPGCYIYKNVSGKIIYIGKAKYLSKRVKSYFQKEHEDVKTRKLVAEIRSIDFFVTKTEIEALILEASLIKKHKPKYNITLKDSTRYAYLVVTNEPFPRIVVARNKTIKGQYFGPFVSGYLRKVLLHTLRKIFFVRTCRTLPKKPCLRYHMHLCKAPCVGYQSRDDYQEYINRAIAFLKGKDASLVKEIERKMKAFASRQEFERAKECKDQLDALAMLHEKQVVERETSIQEDAVNYVRYGDSVSVAVFSVRRGVLQGKEEFTFEYSEDFLDEFLRRFYETRNGRIPQIILVPDVISTASGIGFESGSHLSLQDYLSQLAGRSVELRVPQRGSRKALLDLVLKNIEAHHDDTALLADEIRRYLRIDNDARVIECFDISHFQGSSMVGSMVRFVDGKPDKKHYRKFKIQHDFGVDDFRSIYEVVKRRYARLTEEEQSLRHGKDFAGFPDLIVIDGGSEQLAFAVRALRELSCDVPVVALAKKFEEIYFPGRRLPVRFDKQSRMMRVLVAARDEAHRFGLQYHRLLRSKKMKE